MAGDLLELLVGNLKRLDESGSEDAAGVYRTMGIVENLSELRPATREAICEKVRHCVRVCVSMCVRASLCVCVCCVCVCVCV